MKLLPSQWTHREHSFSAFITGPLLQFWRQRQVQHFSGRDGLTLHYLSYTSPSHRQVVLISPGRGESYIKYTETAWDLFHCGYDVFIIDHRGQGFSDRILANSQLGHVDKFSDYVDDLEQLCELVIRGDRYQHKFLLAHSMGGAIATLLLQRQPDLFNAIALVAPMFGITLPMPEWLAERILNWTEVRPHLRESYAPGTGDWHATPFGENTLTHSRVRYQRNLRLCADHPRIQIGGPTTHWVREAINAGREIEMLAPTFQQPIILLQAQEDVVVDNQAQNRFCLARQNAGYACYPTHPIVLSGARHEILFEKDPIRAQALQHITDFFTQFTLN